MVACDGAKMRKGVTEWYEAPYVTLQFWKLFRYVEILFRDNEILFRYIELLFRYNEVLFRGNEILYRDNELLFRYNELIFRYIKINSQRQLILTAVCCILV